MKFMIRWRLVVYDILILALVDLLLLVLYKAPPVLLLWEVLMHFLVTLICIFGARFIGGVYKRVWRYGGIQSYIRLLIVDGIAFWITYIAQLVLPIRQIAFSRVLSVACMTLLGTLAIRMMYRYSYKYANEDNFRGKVLRWLLLVFARLKTSEENSLKQNKIKVAIVGAGRLGIALSEDLSTNASSPYVPCCFIDVNKKKVGKVITGIPVLSEDATLFKTLGELGVAEVILAIQDIDEKQKKRIFA